MSRSSLPPFDLGMLEMTLLGAASILFIVSLICFVVLVAKMFLHKETSVGVLTVLTFFFLGVGQFIAVIFGWMKVGDWKIKRLMMIYTISLFSSIIFAASGYGILLVKMVNAKAPNAVAPQMPATPQSGNTETFETNLEPSSSNP